MRKAKIALVVAAVLLVVVLLPYLVSRFAPTPGEVTGNDVDIRFVGIRPDEGDAVYDAAGKKILDEPSYGGGRVHWNGDQLRRDFLFDLPEDSGDVFVARLINIRLGNRGRRIMQITGHSIDTPSGRRLAYSGNLPRAYGWRYLPRSFGERRLKAVDITLSYFSGPRTKAACLFEGPFTEDGVSHASGNTEYSLTVKDEKATGFRGPSFHVSYPGVYNRGMKVLAYSSGGNRHELSPRRTRGARPSPEIVYTASDLALEDIDCITVGEKPREKTWHNVRVQWRGLPERTHPEYLDRMAERLELTHLSAEQLEGYNFESKSDAIKVIDVVRGNHIYRVMQVLRSDEMRSYLAGLDEEARTRIRETATKWAECGYSGTMENGLRLGLNGGWCEFVPKAFEVVRSDDRQAGREAADALAACHDLLTAEDVAILGEETGTTADPYTRRQLLRCASLIERPEAAEVLLELARDERPWVWIGAMKALNRHVRHKERNAWDRELKKRAIIALGDYELGVGDEALIREAHADLPGLLTTELAREDSGIFCYTVLQRLVDVFDTDASTAAIVSFLESIDDPEQIQDSFQLAVIRLNLLHGTDLGCVGKDPNISLGGAQLFDNRQVLKDALAWSRTGVDPGRLPVDFRVSKGDFRVIWLETDDIENSVIGIAPRPADPADSARCHRLKSGDRSARFRISPVSANGDSWKVAISVYDNSEEYSRSLFGFAIEVKDFDIPLKLLPWKNGNFEKRMGDAEVHIERADSTESVLSGTTVFEDWWEKYGPETPAAGKDSSVLP